ncbi:MAG: zinc-ribbon domain-containing protein [Kofleriaceae bacterium]
MRCPTCGTENVPDSRFCGACGAKLTPAENRVAPTAKISDDAPFPAHYGSQSPQSYAPASNYSTNPASIPPASNYPSGPASIPPSTFQAQNYQSGPASIPPNTYQAPASIPPTNLGVGGKPASVPPQLYGRAQSVPAHEPSMSIPVVARPRWGLILLVLLLDVGLAAAGAVMLQKGLAKPDAVETPAMPIGSAAPIAPKAAVAPTGSATPIAPKAAVAPTGSAPPKTTASPAVAASIAAVAQQKADPSSANADTSGSAKPEADARGSGKADKKSASKSKAGPSPQDPYEAGNNLRTEIELAVARSRDDIDQCRADAGPDLRGRIDIGFRVQLDGRVDTLKIIENTTHQAPLATCLQTVISHWAFASHPAQPSDFVRPFIY